MKSIIFGLVAVLGAAVIHAADTSYESPGIIVNSNAVLANLPVFYESLKEELEFPLSFEKSKLKPAAWRAKAKAKVTELLITPLVPDSVPFNMVVVDEIDRGNYTAQKIVFNITAHSRVRALLLVPKSTDPNKKFPAALFLHDHGAKFDIGKEKFVETWGNDTLLNSSIAWSQRFFSGRFPGDALANRGYVVLSTDALGWGDRYGNGFDGQQALASNMFNLGNSLAGTMAVEDIRAAKFLASLKYVNKAKVSTVGFSMGAFRAWQLAALSDDIKAVVVDCWMGTAKGLMTLGNNQLKGTSAFYMLHPGLFRYMDIADVAAIAAPKPFLIYNGLTDGLFDPADVAIAVTKMQAVWKAFGAGSKFTNVTWPLGHVFYQEQQDASYDWLDAQFK